jgi:predicted metal-binding protein
MEKKRIAVFYCKKIKDSSCIGCTLCLKAISERNGEYRRYDGIDLTALTHCGDCPGLLLPRVKMITTMADAIGRKIDAIHLGTCMKMAMETGVCPIDFNKLKPMIETKYGVDIVLGTHSY